MRVRALSTVSGPLVCFIIMIAMPVNDYSTQRQHGMGAESTGLGIRLPGFGSGL